MWDRSPRREGSRVFARLPVDLTGDKVELSSRVWGRGEGSQAAVGSSTYTPVMKNRTEYQFRPLPSRHNRTSTLGSVVAARSSLLFKSRRAAPTHRVFTKIQMRKNKTSAPANNWCEKSRKRESDCLFLSFFLFLFFFFFFFSFLVGYPSGGLWKENHLSGEIRWNVNLGQKKGKKKRSRAACSQAACSQWGLRASMLMWW